MKGIYVLIIEIGKSADIAVGKRRNYYFQPGYYAYVGSALSGLESRLRRHLRTEKRPHWHIDYLLKESSVENFIYAETTEKKECNLAKQLSLKLAAVAGFGCSDCSCQSHLFFCQERLPLEKLVDNAFLSIGLKPFSSTTTTNCLNG
ncbi:MAG: GIY-YIG nuclease family protein [Dehalococcoidales bacterium]|jgi:Uri superfamily endonuclease|nr:GIY-YIG nuclease family protein [Dehalococcoidales bacterium]